IGQRPGDRAGDDDGIFEAQGGALRGKWEVLLPTMPAKGACVKPWRSAAAALELPADLARGVLLGVDVGVRVARLERLERGGEAAHARTLLEVLRGEGAGLRQLAGGLGADDEDRRPRLTGL